MRYPVAEGKSCRRKRLITTVTRHLLAFYVHPTIFKQ